MTNRNSPIDELSQDDITAIAIYRKEIFGSDQYHKSLALFLGLIAVGCHMAWEITGMQLFWKYVIVFSISAIGAILRLDTLVHRMGAFCAAIGDPWESWKEKLKHDRLHLTISDIALLVPLAICLVKTYIAVITAYGWGTSVWYGLSMVVIVGLVIFWGMTPKRVRILKEN